MNKQLAAMVLGGILAIPVLSHAQPNVKPQTNSSTEPMADLYFSLSKNPTLSQQEKEALEITKRWSDGKGIEIRPIAGNAGTIKFIYGIQQPSIVCAVLQVCDVALQTGELVNSIHLGDTARWIVEPAITGSGPGEIQHLIIKPMDVGLDTSLVVTTNRRTYHLRLRSHRTEYMSSVAFTYPEDALAKWNAIKHREAVEREKATIPTTGEYLGNLSFDYEISGNAPWKPTRVYNDGRKTIIELPKAIEQTEAPTLMLLTRKGGLFHKEEFTMVNYRVQSDRFIVDSVFEQAVLISGVGGRQQRIVITRRS